MGSRDRPYSFQLQKGDWMCVSTTWTMARRDGGGKERERDGSFNLFREVRRREGERDATDGRDKIQIRRSKRGRGKGGEISLVV